MLVHADHIWSVNDSGIRWELASRDLVDDRLIADKNQLVVWILVGPRDPARDNFGGTMVAAHCIECKADAA